MKKELNGKSRRKWVVGGAMVFGSVALLSTGFATWVIGASQNTADGSIGVKVDTVENKSVAFSAEVVSTNNDITFGDTVKTEPGIVQYKTVNENTTIGVKLTATCSADYLGYTGTGDIPKPGKVGLEFNNKSNLMLASKLTHGEQKVQWTRSAAHTITAENDAFQIFGLKETSITPEWSDADASVVGVYTFTAEVTVNFTIGGDDLWNGTGSFAGYVNSLYSFATIGTEEGCTFKTEAERNGEIETNMEEEINAIYDEFKDNKLTIKLSLGANSPTK